MTQFTLSERSLKNLEGVHPDLVRVVKTALKLSTVDFVVIEGLRTVERQKQLVAQGASTTMNSRHLKAKNGFGHAVDIVPLLDTDGDGDKEISWHWPHYDRIKEAMMLAASAEKVSIEWGGAWVRFKDAPHWQLPFSKYPK